MPDDYQSRVINDNNSMEFSVNKGSAILQSENFPSSIRKPSVESEWISSDLVLALKDYDLEEQKQVVEPKNELQKSENSLFHSGINNNIHLMQSSTLKMLRDSAVDEVKLAEIAAYINPDFEFNITVLGSTKVGKTSFIYSIVNGGNGGNMNRNSNESNTEMRMVFDN